MSKTSFLIPNPVYKPLPFPPSLYITMKTRFAQVFCLPGMNTILSLLLAFMLTACSFDGIGASPATIQHSNEQLTPVTPGIQLGEQPCPALLKNPAHWTTVVDLHIGQTVEVICGRDIKAGTNKTMTFSSSVPYTSSFLDGTQEGILALYVYNTSGAIITVAMVKVLLT